MDMLAHSDPNGWCVSACQEKLVVKAIQPTSTFASIREQKALISTDSCIPVYLRVRALVVMCKNVTEEKTERESILQPIGSFSITLVDYCVMAWLWL